MNVKRLFFAGAKLFILFFFNANYSQDLPAVAHGLPFNKIVVWGHKLGTHTHSYIHYGFVKAFKYLGYPVQWLDNDDDIQFVDFTNSLFITEGQVDQKIPIRLDCFYILHNCDGEKYEKLFAKGQCINLQVYAHWCLKKNVVKLDECIYYDLQEKFIYMPWATDLLPYEIDQIKKELLSVKKDMVARFVGTSWGGQHGNKDKADAFNRACNE